MHSLTLLSLAPLLAGFAVHAADTPPKVDVRYPPPSIRLPPAGGYQGHNFGNWQPPPPERVEGFYHFSHSSDPSWVNQMSNVWVETKRVKNSPDGTEQYSRDFSWSTCIRIEDRDCKADPNERTHRRAMVTPIPAQGPTDQTNSAAYNATGLLNAIIAWGVDDDGHDYLADYAIHSQEATDHGGFLVFLSRSPSGVSTATAFTLTNAIAELAASLKDVDMAQEASHIWKLRTDNRNLNPNPNGNAETPAILHKEVIKRQVWPGPANGVMRGSDKMP